MDPKYLHQSHGRVGPVVYRNRATLEARNSLRIRSSLLKMGFLGMTRGILQLPLEGALGHTRQIPSVLERLHVLVPLG